MLKMFNKNKEYIYKDVNAANRETWVAKKLKALPEGAKILDAGAGEMQYKKYCTHLDYTSQDACQYKGQEQGNCSGGLVNTHWDTSHIDIVSDITNIPLADNSFDAILCTEVFEHIVNPIQAIAEFSRLLKKGGNLILTAPFCSLTHQTPYYFCNGFSTYWYEDVLNKNGFEVIEKTPNGDFFRYLLQELNRLKYMQRIYVTTDIKYPQKEITAVERYLEECSKNQEGSEDILCFGWHIHAKKL